MHMGEIVLEVAVEMDGVEVRIASILRGRGNLVATLTRRGPNLVWYEIYI